MGKELLLSSDFLFSCTEGEVIVKVTRMFIPPKQCLLGQKATKLHRIQQVKFTCHKNIFPLGIGNTKQG